MAGPINLNPPRDDDLRGTVFVSDAYQSSWPRKPIVFVVGRVCLERDGVTAVLKTTCQLRGFYLWWWWWWWWWCSLEGGVFLGGPTTTYEKVMLIAYCKR